MLRFIDELEKNATLQAKGPSQPLSSWGFIVLKIIIF